jgi:hypothetical protein
MAQKATFAQGIELLQMIQAGTLDRRTAQALIEGRVEILDKPREQTGSPYRGGPSGGEKRDLVNVPDLSAAGLIQFAQEKLGLTYLDADLAKWDFVTDERGKTYEVKVWKPGRGVVPATEVREHFTDGFVGNAAAFVAWVTKHNPEGFHASIPEDDRLFQHGGRLCAPDFLRDGGYRGLGLDDGVRGRWYGDWCFVAFREFKST